MISPVTTAIVSGGLIVAGKWADGKGPTVDNAVGVAGIALGLALLEQADERLSSAFAVLILVSIGVVYLPKITTAVGFNKSATGRVGSGLGAI